MPPTFVNAYSDDSKKRKMVPGLMLQRKVPRLDAGQIQHLSAHEKDQVQDFRNWVSRGSEGTSRSAPESPIIGLIEALAASLPSADTSKKSSEPVPEAADHTPAAANGASNAGESGSCGAEGSKGPSVRLVPFQSMPRSSQEELGKELFDDPLLSLDNIKKLADCMQWSFKFTKDVANRSFLKSHALYKTVDNRKILEEQKATIARRLDEALAARNKLYEASQQYYLEVCSMKCQIKNLEEERSKLQEENSRLQKQLQTAQTCKHPIFCLDFAFVNDVTETFFYQVLKKTNID